MQHYGMENVWEQGDVVTRGIVLALIVLALLSWTVIALKLWDVVRVRRMTRDAERLFWHSDSFHEGLEKLGDEASPSSSNPFAALALTGHEAADHHRTLIHLHGRLNMSDWIARCLGETVDETASDLQRGLAMLASIGSTGPFVGLFGTVWGIYHALLAIGVAGEARVDQVAGPIGESLIMTACGLFVAIPAVLGYNALTRANAAILTSLNRFSHALHAYFVTGSLASPGTTMGPQVTPDDAPPVQADDSELGLQ
ncbi:MotA/TolQ/ExbB proton channel family protein [Paraburkholderia saeva]|uniref:Biopolymer transport protein ExbB n=1 Tax=Paraburkholderia saeva TaxID=2777537 RepID=A0A9N8S2A7_9BURK|nr:MotA/TolQ/ExbB proton channel family protein [Paraburkholderia saeva]CAG4892648.1 Tol-Pal system protein TolQ [Paraburkholderia saeva]CAG4923423.1 Tol-Pal system protein TolQ [Paraburkholderia saeva]